MQINAIGADYAIKSTAISGRGQKKQAVQRPLAPGYTSISFKGGNQGDVLHVIAELEPSFKTGGVATVGKDYKSLNNIGPNEHGRTVIFTPYYNGDIKYDKASGELIESVDVLRVPKNLPAGHPLKGKEGTPFFTTEDLSKITIEDLLKGDNYILLEEVTDKNMQWGLQEKAPVRLYHMPADKAKCPKNTDIFFVYTEGTASMTKPYEGGGYATTKEAYIKSWNGDPYAQFDKASVECMKDISKKIDGFDPGTVICSDSHAAYVSHYMAVQNAAGDGYFQGKKPTQVGHNLGDGYIGKTSPRNMLVNLGATKEQLEKLIHSEEYINAVINGNEDEFLIKFIKGITSDTKKTVSAMDIPIYYGLKGYLPTFSVVSEGYYDATITNPEVAESLHEDLKKLNELKRYIGLTNALNDPGTSAFVKLGMEGYGRDIELTLKNGTKETIKAFEFFDKAQSENLDYVRKIKRQNKINLLKRFQPELEGAIALDKKGKPMSEQATENLLRAGLAGKDHEVIGSFSKKYIEALEKGEDVKLMVSWGRGDFQKALDTVVDAFEQYVENAPKDDKTLLLLGGDLTISPEEGERVINRVKLLSEKEKFRGKIVLMNGFAPGLPFASAADVAAFPSRFAPCELTDLEAMHMLCTPIVTNCQGLAQKNFDPDNPEEAARANGYKTKHDFYISEEEALKDGVAPEKQKNDFLKVRNKLANQETKKFKIRTGSDITKEELQKRLAANNNYQKAFRELRDSIVAKELSESMQRALITHRDDDVAKNILKNQVNIDTTWEGNGWLSRTKMSSAELYRQKHIKASSKNLTKNDILTFDFSELTEGRTHGGKKGNTIGEKISNFVHSKGGKWTLGIAGGAAVVSALGYVGYKTGWLNPKFVNEKKPGELSCIG